MFICAQLEGEIVKAVAILKAPITGDHIIPLERFDDNLLGCRYNRETGEFEPPEPDEAEGGV